MCIVPFQTHDSGTITPMKVNNSWHSYAADKLLTILGSNSTSGLTSSRVIQLQEQYGSNELPENGKFHTLHGIIRQMKSPLSIVLIVAGAATIFLGEYLDASVITIAVLINIVVGVLQEGKADRVFLALKKSQEKFATVLRSGKHQVIPAAELVPGDIVVLRGGGAIPADIRLLKANNLMVNESSLTGEWLPVDKIATPLGRTLPFTEQKNMAWMGTLVASGDGQGVVVAIGEAARFGQIARSTQETNVSLTPLQKSIQRIARFLMGIIGVALAIILVLGLLRGEPLVSMILLAIAVAVAAMPEGLPAAVTVVLALGMESILRKGGLVKNLLAAETLGSTTVILTDKTGTLTQGRMLLSGLYTACALRDDDLTTELPDNKELLRASVLSSDAFVEEDKEEAGKLIVHGRPLEKAIMEAGLEDGISQDDLFAHGYNRLDFIQFESSRRYAISLNKYSKKGNRIYISGSPEHILARSKKYFFNGRERKLDAKTREMFLKTQNTISAQGMRFTAVAYLKTTASAIPEEIADESNGAEFVFLGLLVFADAVRADVPASIRLAQSAGARIIMATGDYPETARAIAYEVGIDTRKNAPVLTGAMITDMNDAELLTALKTHNIVARVLPEQKLRLVRLLRNSGEVVAMTGDGVNDAPALVAADIGIAVGSGTEVAKAAADLILVDNSFSVITDAISEGRRIVSNLRKIVTYLLSTSFSEIVLIGGALVMGVPLPLLPTQILWANIVQEGFMSFPFAFEPAEEGSMQRKPEKRGARSILTKHARIFIFAVGAITGVLLLGLFFLLIWGGVPIEKVRTLMFVALSIDSMFFTFSFKDLTQPLWRINILSNKYLLGALAASFTLLLAALTLTPLQKLLSLTTLSVDEVGVLVVLGLMNLVAIESVKLFLNRNVDDK